MIAVRAHQIPPRADRRRIVWWTASRKEAVLSRFIAGESAIDLCAEHHITADELSEWARLYQAHGRAGLKTTKIQHFRARAR